MIGREPVVTRSWWLLAICACLAVGCSKYESSVYGVVTLDGEPLEHGTIKFAPVESGPAAYGMISEGGTYRMQTGREPGLPAGEYLVTVAASENTLDNWTGPGPPPPGKPIVPPWYNDPQLSGLQYTVESGRNEIDLQLTRELPERLRRLREDRRRR